MSKKKAKNAGPKLPPDVYEWEKVDLASRKKSPAIIIAPDVKFYNKALQNPSIRPEVNTEFLKPFGSDVVSITLEPQAEHLRTKSMSPADYLNITIDHNKKPDPKSIKKMSRKQKIALLEELNSQSPSKKSGGSMMSFKASTNSPLKRPSTALQRKNSGLDSTVKKASPQKDRSIYARRGSVGSGSVASFTTPQKKRPPSKIHSTPAKPVEPQNLCSLVAPADKLKSAEVIMYLGQLKKVAKNVSDPQDDIEAIFNKITAWKEKFGNLDDQEKAVARKLRTKGVKIHNVKTLTAKLNELKGEIGLNDDEICLIIYTSLDHDWLTNLLVLAGQFTMWFNINFEGESREEQDFKENKEEIWMATCFQADQIINAHKKMTANQEEILTQQWWEYLRFSKFGLSMAQKFKQNPSLMTELRSIFKLSNDKIAYFDLFQFIEHILQIQLQSWEEDALEGRLDRLGMAFVEFNEFNEFSQTYGIDWGEALLETDMEDILDAKLNLSYKDYQLNDEDFFMGCPSMLTSEKAALAKVSQLYKKFKAKKAKFFDNDFGPRNADDLDGSAFAMYKTGAVPRKGYAKPSETSWVMADELKANKGKPVQFVDDGVASNDCVQGDLGDCWFISALSVLATRDELLIGGRRGMEYDPDMIVDKEIASILDNGVYPPIFHKFRSIGLYVLRFFKNFNWIYVIVDSRIPVNTKTHKPCFGRAQEAHELWVSLCEKAYAKMHGCYENLISGYVDEGIQELTGMQPEKIFIRDEKSGVFPHKMIQMNYGGADGFWQFLLQRDNDSCLLGCSIKGYGKEGQLILDGAPTGLILNHAYGINDLFEINIRGTVFKLLRLRNPWGNTEWLGAWSGDSAEMEKYGKDIQKQYIDKMPPDEQFELDADDGTFLMLYDDWRDNFSTLFLNIDFPEDWTGVRFKSQWNKSNSAGLPTKNTKEIVEKYGKNPQFLIKPAYDTEIMLSLTQLGGRLPVGGKYSVYPFSEQLHYAAVAIFEVNQGEEYLSSFDPKKLKFMSPIKQERENSGRTVLQEGKTYVIVCSTEIEGKVGEFYLNVYFNQSLRDVQLKRIFHPSDSMKGVEQILPYYIPEESEKLSNQTPLWKIQLVQESLKFMMTDEDAGMPADDGETNFENSPQPGAKKAPSDSAAGLVSLVRPEDKLTSKQVIAFLNGLIQTKNKVDDPLDDIETIFNKIQKWKEAMGDLEEQETGVAEALKTPGVAIHNVKTLIEKLTMLQPQIGLTIDEIMIIIYTSLDHDNYTNMLVQAGQFTMWFNLNFEGESQEEVDFRDNKYEIWEATCFHAQQIIDAYKKMAEKDQETILTQKWWDHLRYSKFGDAMVQVFTKQPALKKDLRQLFKNQQEKLSYWNLFQFIEHKLQIKLEIWEEDALEGRLDRLGFAFIEFNEFNEFSQEYKLDWGEDLLETDLEDILDAKMNLSYKDYQVTKEDYFMGCPTMLNSEKAALNICESLVADVMKNKKKNGNMFVDQHFGPKTLETGEKKDEVGQAMAMYKTGEIPRKGYQDPKKTDWPFIKDISKKPPQFIDDGVASDDCVQGTLGDCWFISAMSVLATRDELIIGGRRGMDYDPDMIVDKEIASLLDNGVYPPIFHRFRSVGLYVIRFFKNFNWIYVIIDQRIPVDRKTKKPVFGHCREIHEMWVPLIEKAYAKLHGCYENLMSGYVDEGIQELTGMQPEKIFIRDEKSGVFPHKMIKQNYGGADGFWDFLLKRDTEGCLLGCSIKGYGKEGQLVIDGAPTGLILNHAYGINDIFELTDPWNVSKKIRLLRLRNPWGHSEWLGAWSGDSTEMKKFGPIIQKTYIDKLPPDEQFELDADDGTFFMIYDDWRDQFSTLFLNLDFPEDWTGVRFKSLWTKDNSGGLPNKKQQDIMERYAKNPQFFCRPAQDTECMISLTQTGGRLPVNKEYSVYPFSEQLNYAAVSIFKVPNGQETIKMFDPESLVFMSPIKRERENSGRCVLKANVSYVICCSTEMQGKIGEFFLSVYFNQGLRDVNLKRVFHEYDDQNGKEDILPYFIPEEAEKLQNATPLWKLNLVKESLRFMMTDEDTGGVVE